MSAKPVPPVDDPQVYPVNITWTQNNGYQMNPQNPSIPKSDTIKFTASDKSCLVKFNPTDTPLGASQTIPKGTTVQVSAGDENYSVGYCICDDQTGDCIAPPPAKIADDNTGTIKVGSGTTAGGR